MKRIQIFESGINVALEIDDGRARLLHFSEQPFNEEDIPRKTAVDGFETVEIEVCGEDDARVKSCLKYRNFKDLNNSYGRKLEVVCCDEELGLETALHMQFFAGRQVVRAWTEVANFGTKTWTVKSVTAFSLTGIDKEGCLPTAEKIRIRKGADPQKWELCGVGGNSAEACGAAGEGCLENTEVGSTLMWRSEQGCERRWEIVERDGLLCLRLFGPEREELSPGDRVSGAYWDICTVCGGYERALEELAGS